MRLNNRRPLATALALLIHGGCWRSGGAAVDTSDGAADAIDSQAADHDPVVPGDAAAPDHPLDRVAAEVLLSPDGGVDSPRSPGCMEPKACMGDVLRTCGSDGGVTMTTCPQGCDAVRLACNVCRPNTRSCSGTTLTACRSDGSGSDMMACPSGCNSTTGECNGCMPSTMWCNGDVLRECTAAGQQRDLQTCEHGCNSARMACNTCRAGSRTCNGATLRTCRTDGAGYTDETCASGCATSTTACCASGQQACGGRCVSTATDSANCGSCGRDCAGGQCVDGKCQPKLVASGFSGANIALTATDAYVVDYGSGGRLLRISKADGSIRPIASGKVSGVAVHGGRVYWTVSPTYLGTDGQVLRANLDGTGLQEIAVGQATPLPITADDSGVYWLNYGTAATNGAVMSLPAGGTTPVVFADAQPRPVSLATDTSSVYWFTFAGSDGSESGVYKKAKAGGAITPLAQSQPNATGSPFSMAVRGGRVY